MVVSEVSTQGTVNTISVENKADQPVLILDGEELLGAKQNRIITAIIEGGGDKKVIHYLEGGAKIVSISFNKCEVSVLILWNISEKIFNTSKWWGTDPI